MVNIHRYMRETTKFVASEGILKYLEEYSHPDETIQGSNRYLPCLRAITPMRGAHGGKARRGKEYRAQLLSSIGRGVYENLNTSTISWRAIIPYLSAIELVLTSTYLIDDIVDRQEERFGDKATWKRFGVNEAIFAAFRLREIAEKIIIEKQETSLDNKIRILDLMSDIHRKTYEGQTLNDKLIMNYDHGIYLERCKYFGGVLGGFVGVGAAILANVSREQLELVEEIMIYYGTGGMIRNDLKDYLTTELIESELVISRALRRIPLEDFRIGRVTYPLHIALSDPTYGPGLKPLLGKEELTSDEEAEVVLALVESGGFDATIDLIEGYKQKALSLCEQLPENPSREILKSLIELMRNGKDYTDLIKRKACKDLI